MNVARGSLVGQVQEELRSQILDGRLPSGSQLPAEQELARAMGVSRTSLRSAVQQLEQDGLIIRRHGHGTFVRNSPQVLRSSLNLNQSASALIRAHGMTPGTRAPEVQRTTATAHEAEQLGISEGEPVVVLERVRTADGRPVVFTRDVLPLSLFVGRAVEPEEMQDENLSLYDFLSDKLGIAVMDGTAWLRPEIASPELAGRLDAEPGTATLVLEQVDRDAAERPVLLTWEHYLAGTFEFIVHRRGPGRTGR